jgi:hypothetical protein
MMHSFAPAYVICALIMVVNSLLLAQAPKTSSSANQDSMVISQFESRVANYVKLSKKAASGPAAAKQTDDPAKLKEYELALAEKIRSARPQARQGDIFTPSVSKMFKRLIVASFAGPKGETLRASLRRAEPVKTLNLHVNDSYPQGVPLQSTPPSLLLDLPKLPSELEYRIVGRDLVLRDVKANLIVDFISNVIPAS